MQKNVLCSTRRDVFKTAMQDVFYICKSDIFKASKRHLSKMLSRCLLHCFENCHAKMSKICLYEMSYIPLYEMSFRQPCKMSSRFANSTSFRRLKECLHETSLRCLFANWASFTYIIIFVRLVIDVITIISFSLWNGRKQIARLVLKYIF